MKKANLLSKKEMKKITGGDPEPAGLCFPAWYCMTVLGEVGWKKAVPDCSSENLYGACYTWDTRNDIDLANSYCDDCSLAG
jgi:bacteriocin-like protein